MKPRPLLLRGALLAALALLGPAVSVHAQGGVPMLTDDTGTTRGGHWEFDGALITEHSRDGTRQSQAPLFEIDYGLSDCVQVNYDLPWVVANAPGRSSRSGLGNSAVGLKWRFVDDAASAIAVSTHPQVEFNNPGSSSRHRGLVAEGTTLVVPLEITGRLGPLNWNVELGRSFSSADDDEWLYGLALGRKVNPSLAVAIELHGTGRFAREEDELVANLGARVKLTEHQNLLVSAGRSVNRPGGTELTFTGYLGVQWEY